MYERSFISVALLLLLFQTGSIYLTSTGNGVDLYEDDTATQGQ